MTVYSPHNGSNTITLINLRNSTRIYIGADSMGAMGRSPPRPKSCGGDAPNGAMHPIRPHRNFVNNLSPLYTAKMCRKKLRMCHYANDKRCVNFSLKVNQKRLEEGEHAALAPKPSWI